MAKFCIARRSLCQNATTTAVLAGALANVNVQNQHNADASPSISSPSSSAFQNSLQYCSNRIAAATKACEDLHNKVTAQFWNEGHFDPVHFVEEELLSFDDFAAKAFESVVPHSAETSKSDTTDPLAHTVADPISGSEIDAQVLKQSVEEVNPVSHENTISTSNSTSLSCAASASKSQTASATASLSAEAGVVDHLDASPIKTTLPAEELLGEELSAEKSPVESLSVEESPAQVSEWPSEFSEFDKVFGKWDSFYEQGVESIQRLKAESAKVLAESSSNDDRGNVKSKSAMIDVVLPDGCRKAVNISAKNFADSTTHGRTVMKVVDYSQYGTTAV